ncbi:MAG: ATP-binding protein [Pseudomonadales bacterium]
MKLKPQLFVVSLLTLSLPWAGCQYVREVEAALRSGQAQSLAATAQAVSAVLSAKPALLYPYPERLQASAPTQAQLYFAHTPQVFSIDGYADEWRDIATNTLTISDVGTFQVDYQAVFAHQNAYLFFRVKDQHIVYHNPAQTALGNGDRLVLYSGNGNHYVLSTSAPGSMHVRYKDINGDIKEEPSIKANWQENAEGYNIELELPLDVTSGRLGFYVVDVVPQAKPLILGTVRRNALRSSLPPWLVYELPAVQRELEVFSKPGLRLRVIDLSEWQLAASGQLAIAAQSDTSWVLKKLYRAVLTTPSETFVASDTVGKIERKEVTRALAGRPDFSWYSDPTSSNRSLLSVAAPLIHERRIIGAVVAEQSSEQFLSFTDSAFNKLLLMSFMAFGFTGLGLLGYASWLSWRVRELSQSAEQMLSDDGRLKDNFPHSLASDEIGDLSRSYEQLLQRIREYTEYLRTLSRKLSHELRTPLAVVHSSLDNLQIQRLDGSNVVYVQRAKQGAKRLSHILTAMSEASRVEESIQSAEPVAVDLLKLLRDISKAYQDIYPKHQIVLEEVTAQDRVVIHAVPELIVQMLDKLVDNAVDFSPPDSAVRLRCNTVADLVTLEIINQGPPLPAKMQAQLFDNMVSLRRRDAQTTHLGLGLHIVRLIAEYHHGSVRGYNLADGAGVCFEVKLPV